MNRVLFLSTIRKIKSSWKRFLSLACLSFLGVGFYAGIQATVPDMITTIDQYFDSQDVYDLEVVSTLGLSSADVDAITKLPSVLKAEGILQTDALLSFASGEKVIHINSISSMDQLVLCEGHLPVHENEIVVEEDFLNRQQLHLGDHLSFLEGKLKEQDYEIVGTVKSPLYLTSSKGNSNLGSGVVDYIMYVLPVSFDVSSFSLIHVTLDKAKEQVTNSDEYLEIVQKGKEELASIQETQENLRLQTLFQKEFEMMQKFQGKVDYSQFPPSKWTIRDRTDSTSYQTYMDATTSISKLGSVFPFVFYFVAILISLISMMRMVEEDRVEIGTLKGLGFSSFRITIRYFLYSFLATLFGGSLGMFLGFQMLPRIIWNIYCNLFTIPFFACGMPFSYGILGFLMAIFAICGSTILISILTLLERPSMLMRPKAPKPGKKILLERISFLWKRISFSNKIVIRNLFRYKRRILVMIIGIMGSTALILVGFGLKDSIIDIVSLHYNHVFVYDQMIVLNGDDPKNLLAFLKQNEDILAVSQVHYDSATLKKDDELFHVSVIVPLDDEFSKTVHLNDVNHASEISSLDDGILLSQKLAAKMQVQEGDLVQFSNHDEEIKVLHIVENYIQDYVYMNPKTYQTIFQTGDCNVLFVSSRDSYDSSFDEEILKREEVMSVVNQKDAMQLVDQILSSLNSVVLVLIISSAILAFVILYNLSTINISERKREISTLKVLGFYDHEVDAYITKENTFITFVGILLGLLLGYYLCFFIIETCEPDFVMFVREIKPLSYVYAAMISVFFTLIVNVITHYHLKKIDMIESLKSNE